MHECIQEHSTTENVGHGTKQSWSKKWKLGVISLLSVLSLDNVALWNGVVMRTDDWNLSVES